MIKIKRKMSDKAKRAVEALQAAKKKGTTYNTEEVNIALQETFHKKCYICEYKDTTSFEIEHLRPHHGNEELKYDWNNLFLVCAHCNNTKLDKYDPIIDCTKEDVEKSIAFRKKGYFGIGEELLFEKLNSRKETENTQQLLQEVYYGSTPQKKMEAVILRRALRKELSEFKECVRQYQEAEGEDKEDLWYLARKHLEEKSPFAAFKRWLIRDNREAYPELYTYIGQILDNHET